MNTFAEVKDDLLTSPVVLMYSQVIHTHAIEAFKYQIVSENSRYVINTSSINVDRVFIPFKITTTIDLHDQTYSVVYLNKQ